MKAPKAINFTAFSSHKRMLRAWAIVAGAGFLLFFGLLALSYLVSNPDPSIAGSDIFYRRNTALFGLAELGCLAVATLAFLRYRDTKGKYRNRIFRQFVAENDWSEVKGFESDRVAGILLGPSSSFYQEEYAFRGVCRGQTFTCLIFQFITGDSQTRRFICLSFRLPKSYPMIILDNRLNDNGYRRGNSNLPDRIPRGVSFELEGGFNNYYSVSTMQGRERAAVQVLPPDIMAALVDCAHNKVDIEISDKDLFLIYEDEFYTEQNITALFGTAEVMLEGLLKLSKTWLALGKWEERMISRAARSVRHKLMTGIGPKGLIAFALIVLLFILLMAGRMSQ